MASRIQQIPILIGDAKGRVGFAADWFDRLNVNYYAPSVPHLNDQNYLLTHPGLKSFGESEGTTRGGQWNDRFEAHYRVSGARMVDIDESGNSTLLGNVPGTSQARMANSFNNQAVVAENRLYYYNPTDGFREITDPNLGNPIDITWVDGYFFFTDGENIYHTKITDEEQIDPLQFSTASFIPDRTIGVLKDKDNQVLVFGRFSVEYFVNRATENFAFQRISSKAQKIGIVGTNCKIELGGRIFILGGRQNENPSFYELGVGQVSRIATREIDLILEGYSEQELAEAVLEPRTERGEVFIICHLRNDTLAYNVTTAQRIGPGPAWFVLKSGVETDLVWRAKDGVYDPRISRWIYGDRVDNRLGELDEDTATQYGDCIECIAYSPLFDLEGASIDELEIQTVPGFASEEFSVSVAITRDGVRYTQEYFETYSDGNNDLDRRYILRRLGYISENVGFKIRCASNEKSALSQMVITYG